jgi:cytochrome c oxidase assembly protein subunit 11
MEQTTARQVGASGTAKLRTVVLCLGVVSAMAGLSYAAVPLYDLFCRVTGYGGETQRAENAEGIAILDRKITVHFDSNTSQALHWEFRPQQREVTLNIGAVGTVNYVARNNSSEPVTGTATFNVTPQSMGVYFNKLECFCFTETTLQPGEEIEMPVVFFIDPDMVEAVETQGIQTVTLSYTFFPVRGDAKPLAGAVGGERNEAGG